MAKAAPELGSPHASSYFESAYQLLPQADKLATTGPGVFPRVSLPCLCNLP